MVITTREGHGQSALACSASLGRRAKRLNFGEVGLCIGKKKEFPAHLTAWAGSSCPCLSTLQYLTLQKRNPHFSGLPDHAGAPKWRF